MNATLERPEPTWPALNIFDRCDHCNAEGRVRVYKPGRAELIFCGHHSVKYTDKLTLDGWSVVTVGTATLS